MGTVATGFGLAPAVDGGVIWACAEAPMVTNINVAVSIDLMTSPEGQGLGVQGSAFKY
jgi:hypothetical protein